MKTFKVLSLLLSYPRQHWIEHVEEFSQVMADEKLLARKTLRSINILIDKLRQQDLIDLQEFYVATFDRSPLHSLHLFEHVHGESRDRGQAMVDLMEMYHANGLGISSTELPDYLPVFLEFLSTGPVKQARQILSNTAKVLTLIKERLVKKNNPYQHVFSALLDISKGSVDHQEIREIVAAEKDEVSFDEIDEQWVEPEAFAKNPFKSRSYMNKRIKLNIQNAQDKIHMGAKS